MFADILSFLCTSLPSPNQKYHPAKTSSTTELKLVFFSGLEFFFPTTTASNLRRMFNWVVLSCMNMTGLHRREVPGPGPSAFLHSEPELRANQGQGSGPRVPQLPRPQATCISKQEADPVPCELLLGRCNFHCRHTNHSAAYTLSV